MVIETNTSITSDLSAEELRKLLKPSLTENDVLTILRKSYASEYQTVKVIQQLDSYDDANYQVKIDDETYLLKIHNGVESEDYIKVVDNHNGDYYAHQASVIHYQNAIMELLMKHNITTSVPIKPIPKDHHHSGEIPPVSVHVLPVLSSDCGTRKLVVRLLQWVPGKPMSSLKLLPQEALADAGRFLGKMDCVFDHFKFKGTDENIIPSVEQQRDVINESLAIPARRYHQWDGQHTLDLRNFTYYIKNEKRRTLIESIIDSFEEKIINSGVAKELRRGIIHGDFNDANILMDDQFRTAGVIDFGDSTESWRVLDCTIAMAYGLLSVYGKSNRMISAAAAVLRGYNSVYPLLDIEREHLILLTICRLACSVTLGAYSFQQNPENKYLLFHAEPAWRAIELVWPYEENQRLRMASAINRLFEQACLHTEDINQEVIVCHDLSFPDPPVADLLSSVRWTFQHESDDNFSNEPAYKRQKKEANRSITFVTGNHKKLEEVKRILNVDDLPYTLENKKVDLPELQGDPFEIAKEKCLLAVEKIDGAVITEDTSLCFNALNGLPGPYIKWFLDSLGHEGLNKMISTYEDKTGFAQTIVAFCAGPGKEPAIFDGRTKGKIVLPRGKNDFGWDPVFEPDGGEGKTYGEMEKEEKDAISHRSQAFRQLREYLMSSETLLD